MLCEAIALLLLFSFCEATSSPEEDAAAAVSEKTRNWKINIINLLFEFRLNMTDTGRSNNGLHVPGRHNGNIADSPENQEFEIATLHNKSGNWEKWVAPNSSLTEGDSVETSTNQTTSQYWSLEADPLCRWKFYIRNSSGSQEKFYVSYQTSSDDITLTRKNGTDRLRMFVALLQPNGSFYLKAVERNVTKFLKKELRSGKTILVLSHLPQSWQIKKSFDKLATNVCDKLVRINKYNWDSVWISDDLQRLKEVEISVSHSPQKWRMKKFDNQHYMFSTPDGPPLYVQNWKKDDVIVSDSNPTQMHYEMKLSPTARGPVHISSSTTNSTTYMAIKNKYLHRVSEQRHAVNWGIKVCNIGYKNVCKRGCMNDQNCTQYFPPLSDAKDF